MIKIRLTFVDDKAGQKELDTVLEALQGCLEIIDQSRPYKGRGRSKYRNLYIDAQPKTEQKPAHSSAIDFDNIMPEFDFTYTE